MSLWSFFKVNIQCPEKNSLKNSLFQSQIGRFQFRFQEAEGRSQVDTIELTWKDFNEHLLVTGGSGSGKTSTVLHQLYEGLLFKACYHSEPKERERFRVGGLVIEAKGDFTPKTKNLAQQYDRENSVIFFGPNHPEAIYDPFGDPDESPLQKAHKINEIVKAASGGKEGSDPFWSHASQKLMMNLFLLHDALQKAGIEVPPISFRYLSLLCMDKGGSDRSDSQSSLAQQASGLRMAFQKIREILIELNWRVESAGLEIDPEGDFHERLRWIREEILAMQSESSEGFENRRGKTILQALLESEEGWSRLLNVAKTSESQWLIERISALFFHREEAVICWRQLAKEQSRVPIQGALDELLSKYQRVLESQGIDPEGETVYTYFKNEYLHPSNEKTSASIAMVVSNAIMPFVTSPFDRLFAPGATFDFSKVIDEGILVVLDMPSSQYGVAQLLATLILKIDFFRTVLNRSRLSVRGENRLVNQDRHLVYFCDEFGSVATSGDQTGEAAFLDKVREYRCSCILAMQGLPSLLRKFSEKEVDALLQNCAIKIFLRNDDPSTNDYAVRSLGSEIKVRLNQNSGAMEHWMSEDKKWGARSYTTHYERASRFTADQFVTFRVGEGVLRLPPRFGEAMIRKVYFDFNPI